MTDRRKCFPDESTRQGCDTRSKIRMKVFAFFEFGEVSASRWLWVQRCWELFGLLLILAIWRLWIPQSVFPQVPFFGPSGNIVGSVEFSAKETHRARQRTLPTDPRPRFTLEGIEC